MGAKEKRKWVKIKKEGHLEGRECDWKAWLLDGTGNSANMK
jgi:hypothetical protein